MPSILRVTLNNGPVIWDLSRSSIDMEYDQEAVKEIIFRDSLIRPRPLCTVNLGIFIPKVWNDVDLEEIVT